MPTNEASSGGPAGDKRIAFATVPLSGHMRPALALAAEMASRGFVVDILVAESGLNGNMTEELQSLHARWPKLTVHTVGEGSDLTARMDWKSVAASTGRLGGSTLALMKGIARIAGDPDAIADAVRLWRAMTKVLAKLEPDLFVADHALRLLQLWAEGRGIPSVILHTPYFATGQPTGCARTGFWQRRQLQDFMERYNPLAALDAAREELGIEAAEGMGMGLNICRSIIESHQGRLWFEDNADGGSTFKFSLPLEPDNPIQELNGEAV